MKRTIPRSLVSKALSQSAETNGTDDGSKEDVVPASTAAAFKGAGSAWKAGALAQSQAAVEQGRAQLVDDILNGRHELQVAPEQVEDPIGSDRRDDWMAQDAFQTLLKSIEINGQDTPILVWPEDPNWKPDPLNPTDVSGARFIMLTGRRRHAAAKSLGLKLRAILAPPDKRDAENTQFEMLFLRFRENEERENLSAFERLLAIGEMYETLRASGEKTTAVAFASRIGVHESIVSRARAVFAAREQILNAFKNAYEMSFQDLQKAMASLEGKPRKQVKKSAQKLTAKRKVGGRNLSLTSENGTLSIKAASVPLSQDKLEELSDLIADFLAKNKEGSPAG
ncbi:ParB N-terminal domain-containing protein [Maritimibacter alkaliphilus]|uniref:ParB N-terminal domain-containing protein n=1 Tax=Maritimibacter alkaliphilus TaxID=404236 RepID=UPI001C97D085|nr:ParB N-terminal domain-containing protein [Maritimibacter alkaliphilus]MBY6092968.1 ParB N-terminal domain-containing protein [Maritimibacter alkaliphilus]